MALANDMSPCWWLAIALVDGLAGYRSYSSPTTIASYRCLLRDALFFLFGSLLLLFTKLS